jgi:hypothetical protein
VEAERGTEAPANGEASSPDESLESEGEPQAPEAPLERLTSERDAMRARLTEAEQLLAEMPSLRAAREELETLRSTRSWRYTAPARQLGDTVTRDLLPTARLALKRALLGLARRVRGRAHH